MSNTCAAARYFQFSFGTYRSLSPAVDLLWNSPTHYTARVISASQDCPASFQGLSAHVNDELSKKALRLLVLILLSSRLLTMMLRRGLLLR